MNTLHALVTIEEILTLTFFVLSASLAVSPVDRFGLVLYDSQVYKVGDGLMLMDAKGKAKMLDYVEKIRSGSCTNLSGGLVSGLELIERVRASSASTSEVASLLLMTDGEANEGYTATSDIIKCLTPEGRAELGPSGRNQQMFQQQVRNVQLPQQQAPGFFSRLFGWGSSNASASSASPPPPVQQQQQQQQAQTQSLCNNSCSSYNSSSCRCSSSSRSSSSSSSRSSSSRSRSSRSRSSTRPHHQHSTCNNNNCSKCSSPNRNRSLCHSSSKPKRCLRHQLPYRMFSQCNSQILWRPGHRLHQQ